MGNRLIFTKRKLGKFVAKESKADAPLMILTSRELAGAVLKLRKYRGSVNTGSLYKALQDN